jgi:hypothetical protein
MSTKSGPTVAAVALTLMLQSVGTWRAFAADVPKPYTPLAATANNFKCLGRTIQLGALLLPAQISAAGKPVLAAPARIVVEPDVLGMLDGQAKLVSNTGDRATWEWVGESADVRTTSKLTADCDGFCAYEIRLEPRRPLPLRSLALEIPRVAATARYVHTANFSWSNVSQGLPELGGKWAGAFVPYVWLGDEERGLAWCAESNEGWELSHPERALVVQTGGDVVTFRANFLDHEQTVSTPLVLRFAFQASPVKPVDFKWRASARILHGVHYESADTGPDGRCELDAIRDGGVRTVVIHDSWTAYFGQMVPADSARFRKLIDACHARGLKLLVYVGYGVARRAPELQGKHDAWSVVPLIPWDPSYKPETRGFDAACARSGWAEWLLAGTDKLFTDYELDGLYFDGTSEAWPCQNVAHGCGWTDAQGHVHPTYPLLATRQLMRGLADTVKRHRPDGIVDVHMSSNFTLPTLAFADSAWNGEQFESHTAGEKFQLPLHAFRTEFMGYAHGIDTEFLCYENRPFTFREAIALAWVHGVEVRPDTSSLSYVTPIWRALDRVDAATAEWHPYWKEPLATADNEDVNVSGWIRDGKALLFVSHLKREAATVHVRLDRRALSLPAGDVEANDALAGTPIDVRDDTVELKFDGLSYRLLEVRR